MSRCLLELMWLKYPSGFSLRSGTQPLDPLQFSFLALEIGCCQVNFAFPSHSSYFPKSPLTGKERLGEERQRGESRPGLPLSLCNFRLPLSSLRPFCQCTMMCYIPSCWHFSAQCVELSSSFGIFLALHKEFFFFSFHWKTEELSLFVLFFSFPLFRSTEPTLPFPPFCPVLIPNSELSCKETHPRTNCIAFPCFLLPVTLSKEAYVSHKHSQENGSQENIFWLTFLLTEIHPRSCRSRTSWQACFFSILIHGTFYCFLPFLIILCPVSFLMQVNISLFVRKTPGLLILSRFVLLISLCLVWLKPSLGSSNLCLLCLMHCFTKAENMRHAGHPVLVHPPCSPL